MSKFFIEPGNILGNDICLTGEDVKHIKNVLRLKCGENIIVCDGAGNDYAVEIVHFESNKILTKVLHTEKSKTEPAIEVTLFQGLPKSDKMDLIIQKSVELGVKRIVPMMTHRSVVKITNSQDADKKVARWQRIALEAAKQCNRGIVPEIAAPISFEHALHHSTQSELCLIPYEKESNTSLKQYLKNSTVKSASIMIGPEGGFEEEEVVKASKQGVKPVSLGPRILRTETAGIAVLSILMYELGDVGK